MRRPRPLRPEADELEVGRWDSRGARVLGRGRALQYLIRASCSRVCRELLILIPEYILISGPSARCRAETRARK